MKRAIAVILSAVMLLSLAACGSSSNTASGEDLSQAEAVTMRVSLQCSMESACYYSALQAKEYIERESGGKITVELYPSSQLGGERESVEQVKNGLLEAAYTSIGPLTTFVPEFMVLDIPFLFNSYEEAWMVLDSNVGQKLATALPKYGLELLSWTECGFRHMTANKPIYTPADLQGVKMRTMEATMHMANFNALGASATPVSYTELYMALSQGLVDAQENPVLVAFDINLFEVQKYMILSGHIYDAGPIVTNNEWYHKLPVTYQKIIKEGFQIMASYDRFLSDIQESEFIRILQEEKGMTIIELTDDQKAAFREISQPTVAELVKKELGEEFVNDFLKGIEDIRAQEAVS